MLASVAPEDLKAAVEDKEKLLGCRLKPWEVNLLNCQLLQVKMKNMPNDQKKSTLYKSQLKSLSDKIARMKRKSDFREDLLLPKKTASTVAQRVQRVRADESTEAREARLAQDRIQTAKVRASESEEATVA